MSVTNWENSSESMSRFGYLRRNHRPVPGMCPSRIAADVFSFRYLIPEQTVKVKLIRLADVSIGGMFNKCCSSLPARTMQLVCYFDCNDDKWNFVASLRCRFLACRTASIPVHVHRNILTIRVEQLRWNLPRMFLFAARFLYWRKSKVMVKKCF